MARKLELSLSRDYVPSWGVVEAVRELFQNALDQEIENPKSGASWQYYDESECLVITSANTELDTSTLLLGASSKTSKENMVGQFGEGYKIAALVLTRLGKELTISCEANDTVWKPRFVKSRKYNADVLTFFIEKAPRTNSSDLIFTVANITHEEWYGEIIPSILPLRNDMTIVASTSYGDILEGESSLVFVNGLLVKKHRPYKYSYNFKPGQLKLDRDRKLASDFDLQWAASKMWNEVDDHDRLLVLIKQEAADVAYVLDQGFNSSKKYISVAHSAFIEEHGDKAVPVSTQAEADSVPSTHKAVIVPNLYRKVITSAPTYIAPQVEPVEYGEFNALESLDAWYNKYSEQLNYEADVAFTTIFNKMKELED